MIDIEALCKQALALDNDPDARLEDVEDAFDCAAYHCGLHSPNYPVPALVNWEGLPPPDIVRLMSGGMWHHWN